MSTIYDVVIVGSGPAGLTAAIYTQRFGLSTVVVAGKTWGGQLMLTTEVENFPGHALIQGPELMKKMRDQVSALGVEIIDKESTSLDVSKRPFVVKAEDTTIVGKTVILATGADTRWLGVPNEARLRGHGVSSCAPCDAFFFRGKPVAVIGGGDSAMEEAQVIAKVSPDVVLIHRRDEYRAQKATIDKVTALKNVRYLYNTAVIDVVGDQSVTGLLVETATLSPKQGVQTLDELISKFGGIKRDGNRWELPRQGVFVAIGLDPNTRMLKGIEMDSHGYIKRFEDLDDRGVLQYATKTNIDGIFTAGDVHDVRYKQAITASAFGCMAAIDVEAWLSDHPE